MATRGKRSCNTPGCPTLVEFGQGGRCPPHRREPDVRYKAETWANRPAVDRLWRGARGRRFRVRFLARHPVCANAIPKKPEWCDGVANEVHHVKSQRTHPELAFELSNCVALCKACHSRETAGERPGYRPNGTNVDGVVKGGR